MTTPNDLNVSDVWQDQADFNRLFRPTPHTFEDRSTVTREMALHLMAQVIQLLECTDWRSHRRVTVPVNEAQIASQLTDIHKYWITLCQTWGYSFDDMMPLYWRKSMVCRQRHAEEWVRSIQKPTVILDLDNVLCDYAIGFGKWLLRNALFTPEQAERITQMISQRLWLDAEWTGIDPAEYRELKHRFRTCGAKVLLPPMPGAKVFVDWCRSQGWQIVVLTSRPIDRYPNLYADTLEWLDQHEMSADFVWWGSNKGEKVLSKEVIPYIQFVVDDDFRFAKQYATLGVETYWLNPAGPPADGIDHPTLHSVHTLHTIMEEDHVRRPRT